MDAMQQVRDYFDLLTDQGQDHIVWRLTSATTQSPLTVEAEPYDQRTKAGGYGAIAPHVAKVREGLERLEAGEDLGPDFPDEKREVAISLLERNLNGIGRTKIFFGHGGQQVQLDQQIARRALTAIEGGEDALHEYLYGTFARREAGSIEGQILDVGTDSEEPAVHIVEHLSGRRISCRINKEIRHDIERRLTAAHVWDKHRIRIRGVLNYDADGRLIRLYDGRIAFIEPVDVSVDDLHDPEFTEGLEPSEYLERLREGELG